MGFLGADVSGAYGEFMLTIQVVTEVLLAVHILIRKQDPYVCMGWLLAVALFPLMTAVFYLGVGVNPFERYAMRRQQSRILAGLKRTRLSHTELIKANNKVMAEYGYSHFEQTLGWATSIAGHPIQSGNAIELLINSTAVYAAMNKEIESAKSFILVQFYQIQADAVGMAFLDLLAQKASEGVQVYVLFDALGSFTLKTDIIEAYRRKGVQMRRFLEIHPIKRRFQINWRNHRKLVVIDGAVSFIGGFNMGELYLQGPELDRPRWVDIIFRVKGPALVDFVSQFLEDWHFTTGKVLDSVVDSLKKEIPKEESKTLLVPVPSGPSETTAPFYSTLLHLLFEAKRRVWIMTPYFVPDKALLHAMRLAVARGVHVRVIVPLKSNHQFTDLCASSYFAELNAFGIDLLRYQFGVCHGKVVLADDDLIFAGSSNMDYRSFFLNFETDLLLRDRELGKSIENFMELIALKSVSLRRRDITGIRVGRLLIRRIMRLIAPLM